MLPLLKMGQDRTESVFIESTIWEFFLEQQVALFP